jgi:hypothetical protein
VAIGYPQVGCQGLVFGVFQAARVLWRMGGFQVGEEGLDVGILAQRIAFEYDSGDDGGDGKAAIPRTTGMAAATPAVAMVFFPDVAKFVGQSLTFVAVTGHTVEVVEVEAGVEQSGMFGENRRSQRVVSG